MPNFLKRARPVPKRENIAKLKSSGVKRARFYYNLDGQKFFAQAWRNRQGIIPIKAYRLFNGKWIEHAGCVIEEIGNSFQVMSVKLEGLHFGSPPPAEKKGQEVFRMLLNEALKIAKRQRKNLSIIAENEKLREYYERFGFVFSDPKNMLFGTMNLQSRRIKAVSASLEEAALE